MADHELNRRDWRDIQVLRAQGVLAEVHVVDLDEADQGLRAYADATGTPLDDVARQVCDRDLTVDRELCVTARHRVKQAELPGAVGELSRAGSEGLPASRRDG